jgi:DNA-binding CsgD family transcriptional regulator
VPVAEPTAPETAEWLDGPGFVEWLESNGLTNVKAQMGRSYEKRIRDWKRGAMASIHTADAVLIRLGLHLSGVPDDLWRVGRRGKSISECTRTEAVRRVLELGESAQAVARQLGIDPKTVRRSVQSARTAA